MKKALGQQGIVGVVNTLKGTFAGHDGCTNAWQIEAEVDVIENPPVRRSQLKKMGLSTGTVSDILDWVQESLGGPSSPTFAKFNPVSQEIGQNNGLVVGRSIMRTLVLADTSAVISTENQWVCPYALRAELSALYDEIGELSSELSSIPQTTDVYLSSAWNLSPWDGERKMSQELVFSPDGGMIETPSGDYWACDRLELTKDGQVSELVLTLNKQYNVDGQGNITVQSPAASFNPNPYIVKVGGKSLEFWFKVDGAGVYGVQVFDAQDHTVVAEQPDHQQYALCDLEFDYNGSQFTLKAKKNYKLLIPSSEFIRDSMASNPGMEFYNIMSQMYLPLSGGETTGTVTVPQLSAISNVVVGDPNIGGLGPNEYGQHLSGVVITGSGVLDIQGKWITDNTWHKVSIEPTGIISQQRFEGAPVSYDNLQLPRTRTGGFPKTLATQEYVNGIVGDIETILEAL